MQLFTYILTNHPNIDLLDHELRTQLIDFDGVQYFGDEKRLVVITFNDSQLKSQVDTIVNAHNPNGQTQSQADLTQVKNALQNLRDFIDNPSPTNAQAIATEKILCRAILYLAKNICGWE
jgi:hypothetical protein